MQLLSRNQDEMVFTINICHNFFLTHLILKTYLNVFMFFAIYTEHILVVKYNENAVISRHITFNLTLHCSGLYASDINGTNNILNLFVQCLFSALFVCHNIVFIFTFHKNHCYM